MYDLFIKLGIAFFTFEILHRIFEMYLVISMRQAYKNHDPENCDNCEQELINEIRKKDD